MELRRKVTGKSNTYDGVFSDHRRFTGGAPVVKAEEYREIFGGGSSSGCSIPVLDLSKVNEGSDNGGDYGMEIGKSDYVSIFGGFRDNEIASSFEEFVARDKARVPSSTSHSSFNDLSHQSSDELKQFNMSYNKISQRSKDGLDGTTHVTQLHVVPGFTCFIDESTSQPKKETKRQKSSVTNNIHPSVNSSKADYPSKQVSRNAVELISKHHQDEFKNVQDDLKSQPSRVSSPTAAPATNNEAASQPKKETKKQKSVSDDITLKMFQADIRSQPSKVSSSRAASTKIDDAAAQLKKEIMKQNFLSDDINLKTSQANIRSQPSELSSSHAASSNKDEAASQLKKEIVKQNSISDINLKTFQADIKSQPSKVSSSRAASATNDEAVSLIKKETEKQKSFSDDTNLKTSQADIRSQPSKVSSSPAASTTNDDVASQPKKETEKQKSLSDDTNLKTFQDYIRSQPSKVSSSHPATNDEASSEIKKETKKQKSLSDDMNFTAFQVDLKPQPSKVSSPPAAFIHAEPPSQPKKETKKQKSLSDDLSSNTYQAGIKSQSSKVSMSRATSATNLDNHNKDYQKRPTATNTGTSESDTFKEIPPTCFDEELDVNSAAATSSAALRKAIEKAQESIRIAKESVGRQKEGLKFSSKSFKDSLKVKARVATASKGEEQKEKDDIMKVRDYKHGAKSIFSDFGDGEKLFGAKRVINEIHEKISESKINPEIPVRSHHELRDDKIVCNSKEGVGEAEVIRTGSSGNPKSIEKNAHEAPQKDYHRPNGFLVLESCDKKPGDTEENINIEKVEVGPSNTHILAEELNNLTVYQNVVDEEKLSEESDQNGYQNLGLLENEKQEVVEQECDEKVASEKVVEDEKERKEDGGTESHKEEDKSEKFYDVYEVEMIVNAQNKEGCEMKETENDSLEETWKKIHGPEMYENSSSDYDDAEESENASDTQDSCKVEQNNNVESSQESDDVSCSSELKVEDTEKKQRLENISADQTASEDNEDDCEAKSDDMSNCGLAELDLQQIAPEQNDVRSESSADTIHGMEIEVKEYKEREEIVEEETVVSAKEEERPEVKIKMEAGTSEEPKVEKEQTKRIKEVTPEEREERERERNRLAVERAIREARERAFADARERVERAAVERANAEVRQRVIADAQEKIAKASDKTAQSKLRAERAAVERATAEARQRALEKAMSQKKMSEPRVQFTEIRQTSSNTQIFNGTSNESALRTKAKQEKDNRIMERAAKALAEKEKRDLLVLREQAERNRIQDNLYAEIKRWSTGKEGNLRALLSTLQYILGSDSGWQPVTLTEIITTSAVKKAYRKATLCVHPDKVQQRGASVPQKIICEKVFDLLKAAWNRFNSEER